MVLPFKPEALEHGDYLASLDKNVHLMKTQELQNVRWSARMVDQTRMQVERGRQGMVP